MVEPLPSPQVEFRRLDITKLRLNSAEKYSVVCANLITPLLLSERKRILTRVEKEGVLVLAGILESEFESVRAAYASQGLRPERTRTEREWRSGVFRNQMI